MYIISQAWYHRMDDIHTRNSHQNEKCSKNSSKNSSRYDRASLRGTFSYSSSWQSIILLLYPQTSLRHLFTSNGALSPILLSRHLWFLGKARIHQYPSAKRMGERRPSQEHPIHPITPRRLHILSGITTHRLALCNR